ncbi:hypothetical protein A8L45_23250 [Veronia pacifica]|uniref:Uncharacterized protein n=1 Tax=Veronia pacifica TaxID=1080227 RepID=A0A1C3E4Q9_9GAMM|nr:hypothetical protein A8L45_23250 [Veronia pacifica]
MGCRSTPIQTTDKTGDITKPQHPEFASKQTELVNAVDLLSRINDPDLMQQASDREDSIEYLRNRGVLLDDPLTMFD